MLQQEKTGVQQEINHSVFEKQLSQLLLRPAIVTAVFLYLSYLEKNYDYKTFL